MSSTQGATPHSQPIPELIISTLITFDYDARLLTSKSLDYVAGLIEDNGKILNAYASTEQGANIYLDGRIEIENQSYQYWSNVDYSLTEIQPVDGEYKWGIYGITPGIKRAVEEGIRIKAPSFGGDWQGWRYEEIVERELVRVHTREQLVWLQRVFSNLSEYPRKLKISIKDLNSIVQKEINRR